MMVASDDPLNAIRDDGAPAYCGLCDRPWNECEADPDGCAREPEHHFDGDCS